VGHADVAPFCRSRMEFIIVAPVVITGLSWYR